MLLLWQGRLPGSARRALRTAGATVPTAFPLLLLLLLLLPTLLLQGQPLSLLCLPCRRACRWRWC